jgi:tetratricopeptide (TPR) repeat protein
LAAEWENSLAVDETAEEAAEVHAPAAEVPSLAAGAADADASSNPEIAETVEEVRFYLEHFMTDQARAGIEKLEALTSDERILDPLRAAVTSAGQPPAEPEEEIAEINADDPAEFAVPIEAEPVIDALPELSVAPDHQINDEVQDQIHHDQTDLDQTNHDQTHYAPAAPEVAPEPAYAEAAPAEAAHTEAGELTALVADLEASLGDSFPQAPPIAEPAPPVQAASTQSVASQPLASWPVAPAQKRVAATPAVTPESQPEPVAKSAAAKAATKIETPPAPVIAAAAHAAGPAMSYSPTAPRSLGAGAEAMHPSDSIDLSEMFGELKHELEEEVAAGDDDPETHYNLGVAFREMGLLDEAIAELQKVCTSIERGKTFAQPVQTYTWLAQCFLDKGVPEAAIRWYEKALNIPGLDDEARVAINYELGSACESAQDKPAALRHFTSVYGSNIDYRDVAERIQALSS